jgi:hypothetical protein
VLVEAELGENAIQATGGCFRHKWDCKADPRQGRDGESSGSTLQKFLAMP